MTLYAVTHAPDVFKAGGGRRAGDRLEALRLDLHRALHGHARGEPEGLRDELAAREGGRPPGGPAPHPRHGRRQRPPREHDGVRRPRSIKAGRPYSLDVHPRQLHGFRAQEDRIARDRAIVLAHFERTLRRAARRHWPAVGPRRAAAAVSAHRARRAAARTPARSARRARARPRRRERARPTVASPARAHSQRVAGASRGGSAP